MPLQTTLHGPCPNRMTSRGSAGRPSRSSSDCGRSPSARPSTSPSPRRSGSGPRRSDGCRSGPTRSPSKLARIAHRSTCASRGSRARRSGVGGIITAVPDLSSRSSGSRAGWSSTSRPPTATTRTTRCGPAEFLAIQGVYPTAAEAREALDGVGKHMALALAERTMGGAGPGARRAADPLRAAGARSARCAGRFVPLIGGADRRGPERQRDQGARPAGARGTTAAIRRGRRRARRRRSPAPTRPRPGSGSPWRSRPGAPTSRSRHRASPRGWRGCRSRSGGPRCAHAVVAVVGVERLDEGEHAALEVT